MIDHPFGPPVPEIHLAEAPLALVVAQLAFPLELRSDQGAFLASFQEALHDTYPVLRRLEQVRLEFTPEGPRTREPQPVWNFTDPSSPWMVAVSRDFLSLSTSIYTNRDDFLARLAFVLEKLQVWSAPALADRFGVRYVMRITKPEHRNIVGSLLRKEVAGTLGLDWGQGNVQPRYQLSDAVFDLGDDSSLHARWGLLPPNGTIDPHLPPISEPGVILDLDVFTEKPRPYSVIDLHTLARTFCERQYRFFRWAVTDEFLKTFGATP